MCPSDRKVVGGSRTMATASVMSGAASPDGTVSTTSPVLSLPCSNTDDTQRCRSCNSTALHVDWAQGDRICTSCGVVDEGHLLDERPEWREFNDDNDVARGGRAGARSGLVVADDARYLGGLQPTTLSKQAFGGPTGQSSVTRKRLLAANHRIDRTMEQMHSRSLKTAKLSHLARKRQLRDDESDLDTVETSSILPEYEQLLMQEEEDAHRVQAALQADKWSLQRAIRLYAPAEAAALANKDEELDDLKSRLDASLQRASQLLYCAYSMLHEAAVRLNLPDRVSNEATSLLCQYASRRDGLSVRGVASTLKRKANALTTEKEEKEAKEALREYNKVKQMGSLCAALLFFTARNLGWPRSLVEVCESIQPSQLSSQSLDVGKDQFIKRKHCSRAMTEIRELFPAVAVASAATVSSSAQATSTAGHGLANFTEHAIRKLKLPPVAEACVRALVAHHMKEEAMEVSKNGKKLLTICASLTYFVCYAGEIMQRLALQATQARKRPSVVKSLMAPPAKRAKLVSRPAQRKAAKERQAGAASDPSTKAAEDAVFGVVSLASGKDVAAEQLAYEMRRMWDAWAEQLPWARTLTDVEQSCGVTRNSIVEYYRNSLHPKRHSLLTLLKSSVASPDIPAGEEVVAELIALGETPLASVLLPHIATVATLMKDDIKA